MHSRADRPAHTSKGGSGRGAKPNVLALQRVVGNAAVGQMLARTAATKPPAKPPKPPRAAKGGSKAPPKKKPKKSLTEQQMKWDFNALVGHAQDARKNKDWPEAAALLERAYELNARKDVAMQLYQVWKEMGDKEEAQKWLDISHGKSQSNEPPVSYQSI